MSALRIVFWIIAGIVLGGCFAFAKLATANAALGGAMPSGLVGAAFMQYAAIGAVLGALIGSLVVIATKKNDQ
jgi:hypothetical protein